MDSTRHAGGTRRDFLYLTAGAMGAVGVGSVLWVLPNSMEPAADTLAMASAEIDISKVPLSQAITAVWRGAPLFIRHRTPEEIAKVRAENWRELRDPQRDEDRVIKAEWLIVKGVCT